MGPERVEQAQTDSFLGPVLLVLSDVILGVIGRQGAAVRGVVPGIASLPGESGD